MLLGLCLGAMCNAWMKHAMTSSWVIAPAPVACMTCLSGKVNPSVQVGIVQLQRILYHWRKVIPQRTNCADSVIRSETLIDYIHAHMRALIGFRQPQPTEQQTDPHESQICCGDHGTPLPSSYSRLLRKLRHTLTLMVSWNHSSLSWMLRGGNKNTSESCKQWHQSEPKHCKSCSKRNTKWWAWTCHDWLVLLHLPASNFHPANPRWANWHITILKRQLEALFRKVRLDSAVDGGRK